MTPTNKVAMRAAVLIHEQQIGRQSQHAPVSLPEYSWTRIQQLQRQIVLARQRGWQGAAKRLTEDLVRVLEDCRRDLDSALRNLHFSPPQCPVSSASNIYADLVALQKEFDEGEIDLNEHTISVTTDSIELEGIELGAFQIRLDWHRLGGSCAYRVVACDPNRAARNDGVTHPHVQDETLCEGDGRSAIQAALAQCRILDFFLLVSQVLHTYARGSAYVEIDAWNGIACSDCGTTMSPDDSYGCQRCGSELCDDCRQLCTACEESYCSGCLSQCPECEMDFCRGCMEACPGCNRRICGHCMEDGLCPSCRAEQSQEEEENDNHDDETIDRAERQPAGRAGTGEPLQGAGQTDNFSAPESVPGAATEPDRLGKTLVPA
jgi:hypothetical protein